MNFSIRQISHIGNRRFNQDRVAYAYSNEALLLVLADGMGGHLNGELAASLTIDTFVESFGNQAHPRIAQPEKFLPNAMAHAHRRIMRLPHDRSMGGFPGTTCVSVLIQDGLMYWGYAGDSRLYLLRNGGVHVRTKDHSVVQQWVEEGRITDEQARVHSQRNQITNCLGGVEDSFYAETGQPIPLKQGDVILLGSDGLWGPFTDKELAESFNSPSLDEILDKLVQLALEREAGSSDNITGVAVRWGDGEAAHETTEPVSHVLQID